MTSYLNLNLLLQGKCETQLKFRDGKVVAVYDDRVEPLELQYKVRFAEHASIENSCENAWIFETF